MEWVVERKGMIGGGGVYWEERGSGRCQANDNEYVGGWRRMRTWVKGSIRTGRYG